MRDAQAPPESDWKVFRELQRVALDRFCRRTLERVQTIVGDHRRTHHERYLDVFRLVHTRDDELASAFNDSRRSRMIVQLAAMYADGLLEPHEFERFTEGTRVTIETLVQTRPSHS